MLAFWFAGWEGCKWGITGERIVGDDGVYGSCHFGSWWLVVGEGFFLFIQWRDMTAGGVVIGGGGTDALSLRKK